MKMKSNMLFTFLAIIFVAGCQPKEQDKPVDLASVKDSISLVIDNYFKAVNSKDIDAYSTLLADDGLFCGSDPGEFWSKKEVVDLMKQQFTDTSFNWKLLPNKQEIKVSSDGKSAIVVNQYLITELSPKIPMREITYITKTENRWLISFNSWNFITENENVEKLNKALE
jgi:uncharacterized protein (TIGR02246 family)